MRAAIPPRRPLRRNPPQLSAAPRHPRRAGARDAAPKDADRHTGTPALRQPQAVAHHRDRLTPPDRAHQFPGMTMAAETRPAPALRSGAPGYGALVGTHVRAGRAFKG